jgi:predicted GNAT family acetyltransferase
MILSLRPFTDPQAFLACAGEMMAENEALHSLPLGIAMNLGKHPEWQKQPPYLGVVEDTSGVVLAGVMTPPFNVVLASNRSEWGQAAAILMADINERQFPLPGVTGPKVLALHFAELHRQQTGQANKIRMQMCAFELRQVNPLEYAPGSMRTAGSNDLALLKVWTHAFNDEAMPSGVAPEVDMTVELRVQAGDLFVWEDGGRLVSMTMRTRPTLHGISVSMVYTPPKFRRRGYARALVARLTQQLLDSGYQFTGLFTDLNNPTSNKIYQEIGYRQVGDFVEIGFEAGG